MMYGLRIALSTTNMESQERVMVNPQVSLLNLTLEADIPGDVMWSLIDGKHIVLVSHHDGYGCG